MGLCKREGALLSSELLPSFKVLTWILRCSASPGNGTSEDQEMGRGSPEPELPLGHGGASGVAHELCHTCPPTQQAPTSGVLHWGSLPWCLFSELHPLLLILTLLTEGPIFTI